MPFYRKKLVVIEAVIWNGEAATANAFLGENYNTDWWYESERSERIIIPTFEGKMLVNVGDYIIKDVNGEFYPCKPDIFEKTYESVES